MSNKMKRPNIRRNVLKEEPFAYKKIYKDGIITQQISQNPFFDQPTDESMFDPPVAPQIDDEHDDVIPLS